MKGLIEQSY